MSPKRPNTRQSRSYTGNSEERNICEDDKTTFREVPPLISGVAIMTDTDNTGESASAYYGDILFRKNGGSQK